ncbi:MAG: hypothetical protein Q7S38_01820 [bacterium]|nr:hypothetical protein [bacterium]
MEVTQEHKNDLEKKIVESVILALENNTISKEEMPIIAEFVLGKIDVIKTHEELVLFVNELALKWPIFSNIDQIEKGEVQEKKESETAESVLNLAKSGQIEDAVNLAKTMTQS